MTIMKFWLCSKWGNIGSGLLESIKSFTTKIKLGRCYSHQNSLIHVNTTISQTSNYGFYLKSYVIDVLFNAIVCFIV